jgi:hypothetical protein
MKLKKGQPYLPQLIKKPRLYDPKTVPGYTTEEGTWIHTVWYVVTAEERGHRHARAALNAKSGRTTRWHTFSSLLGVTRGGLHEQKRPPPRRRPYMWS